MVTINLNNWWTNEDNFSKNIFKSIFQDQNKNIEVYSVFGDTPSIERKPNTLYVQFTGESYYNDPSMFDINFIPNSKEENNIIIYPLFSHYLLQSSYNINNLLEKRICPPNKCFDKFCLFSVSNGNCKERNDFFNNLSNYKKVDSCGKHMNNMGMNCPGSDHVDNEYFEFISNYKFMISFENISKPNYFTEKLLNAYYNKTIPIYWGCPNISEYVNIDAILYLKPNFTQMDMDDLIEEIKYLDNNADEYKKKYESIFFKDGILPEQCNINKMREKVNLLL